MVDISQNEFPRNAHSLGPKLLSYVLDKDIDQMKTIMTNGGTLDAKRYAALMQLDSIMQQVKQGRVKNQALEFHDRIALPSIRNCPSSGFLEQLAA